MGGSVECISAGVPVVTWAHFADQQPNSDCFIENKAGIALWSTMRMESKVEDNLTFKQPIFDAAKITKTFNEVLNNPMYRENMQRLNFI